jgi:hypothetical protein
MHEFVVHNAQFLYFGRGFLIWPYKFCFLGFLSRIIKAKKRGNIMAVSSSLVAPKGLRKAISIIMIIVGAILIITGMIYTISAGTIDTSSTSSSAAIIFFIVLLVIGIITLVEGAFYLVFGVLGCANVNDGKKHKKLLTISLLLLSCLFLATSIINIIEYVTQYNLVIYIFLAIISVAAIIFISLSLFEASRSGHNEKLYGILGSSLLLAFSLVNSVSMIISNLSSTTSPSSSSIASSIIGLLAGLAIYVLYLAYFIKLSPENKPTISFANPTPNSEEEKAKVIAEYKDLLDKGAISQEEYDKKKDELLK